MISTMAGARIQTVRASGKKRKRKLCKQMDPMDVAAWFQSIPGLQGSRPQGAMLVPNGEVVERGLGGCEEEREQEAMQAIGTSKHCVVTLTTHRLCGTRAHGTTVQHLAEREDTELPANPSFLACAGSCSTAFAVCTRNAACVHVYDVLLQLCSNSGGSKPGPSIAAQPSAYTALSVHSKAVISLKRRKRGNVDCLASDGSNGLLVTTSSGVLLAYSWAGRLRWRMHLGAPSPPVALAGSSSLGVLVSLCSDGSATVLNTDAADAPATSSSSSSQAADGTLNVSVSATSNEYKSTQSSADWDTNIHGTNLVPEGKSASSVFVSEGWRSIIIGTTAGEVRLYSTGKSMELKLSAAHQVNDGTLPLTSVVCSPSGEAIAALSGTSESLQQRASMLTPAEGHILGNLHAHAPVHSLAWGSDCMSLLSAHRTGLGLSAVQLARAPVQCCASSTEPAHVPLLLHDGLLLNDGSEDDDSFSITNSSGSADDDVELTHVPAPAVADGLSHAVLNRSSTQLAAIDSDCIVVHVLDMHSKEWQPVCTGTHAREQRAASRANSAVSVAAAARTACAVVVAVAWLHDDTLGTVFSDGSVHVHQLGTAMPIASTQLTASGTPLCASGQTGKLLVCSTDGAYELLELSTGAKNTEDRRQDEGSQSGFLLRLFRLDGSQHKHSTDPSSTRSFGVKTELRHKLFSQMQSHGIPDAARVMLLADGASAALERPGGLISCLDIATGAEETLAEHEELTVAPAGITASQPRLASHEVRMGENEAPVGFGPLSVAAAVQLPSTKRRFRPAVRAIPSGHFAIVRALQNGERVQDVVHRLLSHGGGCEKLLVGNVEAAFAEAYNSGELTNAELANFVRAMPRALGLRGAVFAARKAGYDHGGNMLRHVFGSVSAPVRECLKMSDIRAATCALMLVHSVEGSRAASELAAQIVEDALGQEPLGPVADVCWEARQFASWCAGSNTSGSAGGSWIRGRKPADVQDCERRVSNAVLQKAADSLHKLKLEDVASLWRAADERSQQHELSSLLLEQRFDFKSALKTLWNASASTRSAASFLLDKAMQHNECEDWRVLLATALSRMDIVLEELRTHAQPSIAQSYRKAVTNALGSNDALQLLKHFPALDTEKKDQVEEKQEATHNDVSFPYNNAATASAAAPAVS